MAELPKEMLESLARHFLPQIKAFFESEEGQKEFEEWKKRKEAEKAGEQEANE